MEKVKHPIVPARKSYAQFINAISKEVRLGTPQLMSEVRAAGVNEGGIVTDLFWKLVQSQSNVGTLPSSSRKSRTLISGIDYVRIFANMVKFKMPPYSLLATFAAPYSPLNSKLMMCTGIFLSIGLHFFGAFAREGV